MTKKKWRKHIILISFLLTVLIFFFAIIISYGLDFVRIDEILTTIDDYKLSTDSYIVETEFMDVFGGDRCEIMKKRISDLKQEIEDVGEDLSKYGQKSFFKKKDFDYLKRKYFILELKLYSWINELNDNCDNKYSTILFFYRIDDDISERQGYILTELAKEQQDKVFVFSFDGGYEDEPLIDLIKLQYNVTNFPTMIVNNDIKLDELSYLGEIRALVLNLGVDKYAKDYDFKYTLQATETNVTKYIERLRALLSENISDFAKGDIYLILGRIQNDDNIICQSIEYYKKVGDIEERAIAMETLASLNCDGNKQEYYNEASRLWKEVGNYFRSDVTKNLANDKQFKVYYNLDDLPEIRSNPKMWEEVIIGESSFVIDENDLIVAQTDRVTRDWLSGQIKQGPFGEDLLVLFSEKLYLSEQELLGDIGWHEGARIKELSNVASYKTASGTLVKKIDEKWYAPDETGIFRFEVPLDKLLYPTTRFLKEDLAVIIDTHGINMIVEQAIRNKASVVIACGDHPGKSKAAKYLSDKGIKVITYTDKYGSLLMNSDVDYYGSPPIKKVQEGYLIGGRPLRIDVHDKIVVMNVSSEKFSISYYGTPAIYFSNLAKFIKINPLYVSVSDFDQLSRVTNKARSEDASIIAARVNNKIDYEDMQKWLEEDEGNKAILFHTMAYPYGYKLVNEFPNQITYGDVNPVII